MRSDPASKGRPRRQPESSNPRPSTWQLVGAFVAPTTTITAMLYYFGWVRASTFYGYFGVDVSKTLGFSAADYVRNSSTVVFTPFAFILLGSLLVAAAATATDLYLTNPRNSGRLRYLVNGLQGAAASALVCAAVLLARPELVATTPLTKPMVLAGGSLLALYAVHVRSLVLRRRPRVPKSEDIAGALYRGILGGMVLLALFWATAILAREQGLRAAHALERNLPSTSGIVVYAHDNEDITGRGVNLVQLDPSGAAAFRFRYTGLRVLSRSADGGYVLLPRGWTHTNGSPAYVLQPKAGIRVDLQALPAD